MVRIKRVDIKLIIISLVIIAIPIIYNLVAINRKKNVINKFITTHGNKDFALFYKKAIHIRDYVDGNPLIIINDNDTYKSGLYLITMNKKTGEVVETNKDLYTGSKPVNTDSMVYLAREFLKYDVSAISVDSSKTVIIKFSIKERPDLIRFSNETFDSQYKRYLPSDLIHVNNLWYKYNRAAF